MKVLFINTVYQRGSTGRIINDLGEMLEKKGHEYRVAYGRGEHNKDPHCYRIGNDIDMYVHAGLSRITDRAGFFSKRATKKLIDYIQHYNPDIIHLHNLHGYYLNIAMLFIYLSERYIGRVIWTLHDCWAFTGHCVHYTYAGCTKWKDECSDCTQKKEYPSSILCDNCSKNYRDKKKLFTSVNQLEIVTVSRWLENEVKQSYLKNTNIRCIYNGIDIKKFRRVQNTIKKGLDIEGKKMILLVSDGWTEQKGYATVLDVARLAPEDWHFVMIGLTKKQITQLPKNITGIERIWNQEKLVEYYSAADVFLNLSIEETFGLVTGEALACKTPVIVMNSTACAEIIDRVENGTIIERNTSAKQIVEEINKTMGKVGLLDPVFFKDTFLDSYYQLYIKNKVLE